MCVSDFKNCKYGVVVGIILVAAIFWLGNNMLGKKDNQPNTIVFSGSGEVFIKPDLAQTSFSVISEAKTVGEALADNTQKMNVIISFIKGQGVKENDLKTTNFSIYPRYEYQRVEIEIYPYPPGKRVLAGYEVQQSLQVKIRDLVKVGAILQGAADAGANQAGDLQFLVDKEDEFKKQARAEAIKEAKDKAKELSSQLGIKLKKIVNFSEGGGVSPIFYMEKAMISDIGGGTPQIETGENKIEVQVSITYEIR